MAGFLLVVGLAFLMFWSAQLLDLMRQRDDSFPGRWDKVMWLGILIFIPVIGAVLYSIRKPRESGEEVTPALEREWKRMQAERARGEAGEGV